jgi:hypothetical protein
VTRGLSHRDANLVVTHTLRLLPSKSREPFDLDVLFSKNAGGQITFNYVMLQQADVNGPIVDEAAESVSWVEYRRLIG